MMAQEGMRVIVVGAVPPPANGMTVFTQMVLNSSLSQQFQIRHLDTSYPSGIPNMGRFNLGAIARTLRQFKQIRSMLYGFQPQIVYMPISYTTLGLLRDTVLIWIAHRQGARIIVHLHNNDKVFQIASPLIRRLLKMACSRIDRAVIVHSMYQAAFVPFLSPERVVAIPNGIPDIAGTYSGISEQCLQLDNPHQILFMSNLQHEKGFLDLIQAIPLIRAKHIQVRFVIAGSVWEATAVEEARKFLLDNNLHNIVIWPGSVVGEAKSRLFLQSDVFAFPTYYSGEAFPIVILEAMSAGLPIVATDHMAIPQIVIHERNGLIVPKRDPVALAQAIIRLLDDDELRERIGRANRSEYLEKYTAAKCIQRMGDLFEKVLAD